MKSAISLVPGDLVEVEITDADGHDLWGAPPAR